MRRVVFISHANPEENDFARWLGAQLASAGYEVWSDVTKLIGGEIFWNDIETAIRSHSAKFVVAISRAAITKSGVQDEVAVAIGVERSQSLTNFVIPLRVDDLEFTEFPANLTRKNAVEFSLGWAAGLANLLKVLERDGVPRGKVSPTNVTAWCESRFDPDQKLRPEPEQLVSNWLPILELPQHISLLSIGVEAARVGDAMSGSRIPWFPYYRLVGTFGSEADLRQDLSPELEIKLEYRLATDDFLCGHAQEVPGMSARDARNHVSSMLRQAWNNAMARRGLSPFEMANGSVAWYFKKNQIERDRGHFVDHEGKRRHRLVVGRSERRKAYWHLGFLAKPMMNSPTRFVLRATILFSEDGQNPITDAARMHRLRRGFCRSWWNNHWRDLLLTYVAWLANDGSGIAIGIGDYAAIRVSAKPLAFSSPVSCPDPKPKTAASVAEAETDEESPPEEPADESAEFVDDEDEILSEDEAIGE